tara:strand:- start:925 stop:1167 length:243 start_codon:yes stop_codon:yes gene_type:complete
MSDWIDKLDDESDEDNQTKYQEFLTAFFKTRTYAQYGWGHSWSWIIGVLEDDQCEEPMNQAAYSKTEAKNQAKKRTDREE